MNKDNFSKNKSFASVLLSLAALANYPDGTTPKGRNGNKRKRTKKGAIHIQGEPFQPSYVTKIKVRDHNTGLMGKHHVSPALYRRLHLGTKKLIVPTYKKPHAKPRGRNLVQPKGLSVLLGGGGG